MNEIIPAERGLAVLNITVNRQNGDLAQPVYFDSTDGDVKAWATEAVRNGDVRGIDADPNVSFADFVVDRFEAKDDLPARLLLRPKTPFGCRRPQLHLVL